MGVVHVCMSISVCTYRQAQGSKYLVYKSRGTYCTCIYLSTWEGKGNFPPISKKPQWLNSVCNFVYSFSLHVHVCLGLIYVLGILLKLRVVGLYMCISNFKILPFK